MDAAAREGFEALARQIILDVGPMIDGGGFSGGRALDAGGSAKAACCLADMGRGAILWRVRLWTGDWTAQVEATTEAGEDRMFGSVDGIVPKVLAAGGASVHVAGDQISAGRWVMANGFAAATIVGKQMEALRKRKNYEQTILYVLAAIGAFAVLRWLF